MEREAQSLIHSLRVQGQSPSEWLAAIAADQRALQFAREWKYPQGLAIQNSELAELDVELGDNFISANCEL